jgi:hypothetical protein
LNISMKLVGCWARTSNSNQIPHTITQFNCIGLLLTNFNDSCYSLQLILLIQWWICRSEGWSQPSDKRTSSNQSTIFVTQTNSLLLCSSSQNLTLQIIDKNAMDAIDKSSLRREIQILQMVQHPNIVSYRDCFETDTKVYLVMELYEDYFSLHFTLL